MTEFYSKFVLANANLLVSLVIPVIVFLISALKTCPPYFISCFLSEDNKKSAGWSIVNFFVYWFLSSLVIVLVVPSAVSDSGDLMKVGTFKLFSAGIGVSVATYQGSLKLLERGISNGS